MKINDQTGEILSDEDLDQEGDDESNVRPLRPQRPPRQPRQGGVRRTSVSGSSSSEGDDAKSLLAHSRVVEVEGAVDRLGLGVLNDTLVSSEHARRGLTRDNIELRERHEKEIDRVRDEYDRSFDAMEIRHEREAARWREDRDRLRNEVSRLEREMKDERKSKKKHKNSVAVLTLEMEKLKEAGATNRKVIGLLAPGVSPIANKVAEHLPDLFSFMRSAFGDSMPAQSATTDAETLKDRAAAIRFAGRLFEPQNSDLLDDLQRMAFNEVMEDGVTVIVLEWERVQRYIWSSLQRESEAKSPKREVVDEQSEVRVDDAS